MFVIAMLVNSLYNTDKILLEISIQVAKINLHRNNFLHLNKNANMIRWMIMD